MSTLLIVIIFLALVFDYINGFHDAANSIATVVSTKVLTPFQAVVWAAFFNFVAFFIFKDHAVANTIAKTVKSEFITLPVIFSGLVAAIGWNLLTWWYGIPSSSSHTLIGGFAGAAIAHAFDKKGLIGLGQIVEDRKILTIILFIFLAPLIGMLVSMFITLVTINRRFWVKVLLIVVATAGTWKMFEYFQNKKISENLSKFYYLDKLKEQAKYDTSAASSYIVMTGEYNKASKLSEDFGSVSAEVIGDRIEKADLLHTVTVKRYREEIGKILIDSLKADVAANPTLKPHLDSIILNLKGKDQLIASYVDPMRPGLSDTLTSLLKLTAFEKAKLESALAGVNVKQELVKSVSKADNSFIRYGLVAISLLFILCYVYVDLIRKPSASRTGKMFKKLQLVSSAIFSIGHGGNDAQKVMGIIAAALVADGVLTDIKHMPDWIPLACYSAIALGTMSGGWKIIKTMGTKITKVTPLEGVSAETSGAMTLFMTEQMGIPVSTTHTITGAIIGVGATKRLSAVRWGVTINLIWAWILTIPVSAILATIVYYISKLFL